jgi:hypothetical protein
MCPYTYIEIGHICDPASNKRKGNLRRKEEKRKKKERERAEHVKTAV